MTTLMTADGRIFSEHPSPVAQAPRDNLSRNNNPSLQYRFFVQCLANTQLCNYHVSVIIYNRSEGFALMGYVVPGCVEDGSWMLWENSSVAVVAAAVLARSFLRKNLETYRRFSKLS